MSASLTFSLQVTLGFGTNNKASEGLNKACSNLVVVSSSSMNPFASMRGSWFSSSSSGPSPPASTTTSPLGGEGHRFFVASASQVELSVLGNNNHRTSPFLLAVFVPPSIIDTCLEKYMAQTIAATGSCFWIREAFSVDSFTKDLLGRIHPVLLDWKVGLRGIIRTSIAAEDNAPAEIVLIEMPSPKQAGGRTEMEILEATNDGSVLNLHENDTQQPNINVVKVLLIGKVHFESGDPLLRGNRATGNNSNVTSLKGPPLTLPTCAVCLHRIDPIRLGLPSPTNKHICSKFCSPEDCHKQRLLKPWEGTRCRSCHVIDHYWTSTLEEEDLFCEGCAMHNTLWVCLTCGFIGCGRYSNKHSFAHFQETNHPFSLELATLRIWDYVRGEFGGFAHRVDFLECPSSLPLSQPWIVRSRASRYPGEADSHMNQAEPRYSGMMGGAMTEKTPKKATMIGEEYEALLQSALEDQAQHYEGEIARLRAELTTQLVDQESLTPGEQREIDEVRSDIERIRRENDDTSRLLLDAQAQEAEFRVTSQQLLGEQQEANEMIKSIEEEARQENEFGKIQIEDLEQQVSDLTANLRMRHQFSQSEELNNAQIFGTDSKPGKTPSIQRKGKKKGSKGRFFRK